MARRYRINRKTGELLREQPNKVWSSWVLRGTILHITPPVRALFGGEFEREDNWVGVCFLDITESGPDIAYTLLNDGKTSSLESLYEYQAMSYSTALDLMSVTTEISVTRESNSRSGHSWYRYRFRSRPIEVNLLTCLKNLLASNPNLQCVDPIISRKIGFPDGPTVSDIVRDLETKLKGQEKVITIIQTDEEVNERVNGIIW